MGDHYPDWRAGASSICLNHPHRRLCRPPLPGRERTEVRVITQKQLGWKTAAICFTVEKSASTLQPLSRLNASRCSKSSSTNSALRRSRLCQRNCSSSRSEEHTSELQSRF